MITTSGGSRGPARSRRTNGRPPWTTCIMRTVQGGLAEDCELRENHMCLGKNAQKLTACKAHMGYRYPSGSRIAQKRRARVKSHKSSCYEWQFGCFVC